MNAATGTADTVFEKLKEQPVTQIDPALTLHATPV